MKTIVISIAMAGCFLATSAHAQTFLGFRLLDLNGHNVRWPSDSEGNVNVTYAFATKAFTIVGARNCSDMVPLGGLFAKSKISPTVFQSEVREAFDMWEKVANIKFKEIEDFRSAGIVIGAQAHPEGHAFANVTQKLADGKTLEIERSLICFNPDKPWKIGFDGNLNIYDVRFTTAHEIGHAIGLDHPDQSSQLMSFRYQEQFRTLQTGDVMGATKIYGARVATPPIVATTTR
jgi:Matrixin